MRFRDWKFKGQARGERREARGERREARGERREARGERREARGERREARGERREARGERREYYLFAGTSPVNTGFYQLTTRPHISKDEVRSKLSQGGARSRSAAFSEDAVRSRFLEQSSPQGGARSVYVA
ncbi:hypothetical protein DA100_19050 [Vibrio sp. Hep-1b-8]|nr:hypothetical protein DA100_19050 [Vibrio sp. Hep-1b-8]